MKETLARPRFLLLLVLALWAPSLGAQTLAAGRSFEGKLTVGGRERSYLVDLPSRYDGSRALPLVLVFHGGGGNGDGARRQTGFTALGEKAGFIAVYPNGTGRRANRLLTWNAGTCCGYAKQQRVDEAAFVRALLDTLQATLKIDPARIYATGLSNGGMMSYLVGCRLGDRVAAIAPVSGELTTSDCHLARPVSLLVIHGTADENLPYDGGVGVKALDVHEVRSVSSAVEFWRAQLRCATTPVVDTMPRLLHAKYARCAGGSALELYTIPGGGHGWPGGRQLAAFLDVPSDAMHASPVIWEFFAAHPKR
jgi:polyhydroxybutyrate depolymerase